MGGKHNKCCCDAGCVTFTDDFNRADSTSLGGNWNETAGDWGITSNELVELYLGTTGTGSAQLFCTKPVPTRSAGEMFVSIKVPVDSIEDGDTYYIWLCCPDSSTVGTIRVEFTYNSATTEWTTAIIGGTGGASATYTTTVTGTPTHFVLKACADHTNEIIKASVSPTVNEYAAWDLADPGTGRYAAIGHNNTGHQNRFDDFYLSELRIPTEICTNCFCACEAFPMPPQVTATIVFATDRALCLEGQTWLMDFVPGPQQVIWEGGLALSGETLDYRLTCGDSTPSGFNLIALPPFDCHNSLVQKYADAGLSTCDPLALYFGPYVLSFPMDCDLCYSKNEPGCTGMPPPPADCSGTFWIVITV